jgi:hypothetical protein
VKVRGRPGKPTKKPGSLENQELTTHRARVKQTIAELEKRVECLTQELHQTRLENVSLQEKNQLTPPGTILATTPPQSILGPEDLTGALMDVVGGQNSQQLQQYIVRD